MMPMQMGRKAWRLEKVENLSRTATAQNILPHAGTNQIALARFCGRIFSQPAPPIWPSETGIQPAIAALAGYESFCRRIL
jgi:hypothetical protein